MEVDHVVLTQNLVVAVIPVLTPLILGVMRTVFGQIPSKIIPILAPIVGVLVAGISEGFGLDSATTGAVLGSAGVGVREIVDQARK